MEISERAKQILIVAQISGRIDLNLEISDAGALELSRLRLINYFESSAPGHEWFGNDRAKRTHLRARWRVTETGLDLVRSMTKEDKITVLKNTRTPRHIIENLNLGLLAKRSIDSQRIEASRGPRFKKRKPKTTRKQRLDSSYASNLNASAFLERETNPDRPRERLEKRADRIISDSLIRDRMITDKRGAPESKQHGLFWVLLKSDWNITGNQVHVVRATTKNGTHNFTNRSICDVGTKFGWAISVIGKTLCTDCLRLLSEDDINRIQWPTVPDDKKVLRQARRRNRR